MLRRALFILAVLGALTLGASSWLSEVAAARPCPSPNCPLIDCPPCTVLVCDPGHCRMHCQLVPDCGA